jgi:hypothetical protein
MQLITNESGKIVCSDTYQHEFPQVTSGILLVYIAKKGLRSIFAGCLDGAIQPGVLDCDEEDNNNWFIEKRSTPVDCDMHWISPSDEGTYDSLLSHIGGDGGMDDLITAVAGVSPPHVKSLVIYQTTFAVMSFCGSISLHIDCHGELHGEVWTAILPLVLVEDSAPELVIKHVHTAELQQLKLNLNTAVVFGPRTIHATNTLKYHDAYRVCLLLSFGFIHKENISFVLDNITTNYPSKTDRALLLKWARKPHWKCLKGGDSVHIPRLDNDAIYGVSWMKMFNQLASYTNNSNHVEADEVKECPYQLRRWISQQRFYFLMKYSTSKSDATIKYGKILTSAREAKLKSIGFCFTGKKGSSLHESKWMKKFKLAEAFYNKNGHCLITPSSPDVPKELVRWVRKQREDLKCDKGLSESETKRKKLLDSIGFKWKIYKI